jgi:hypothetical protein
MKENIKKALKIMLYLADSQPNLVDSQPDFEDIDFKKPGWFSDYTWTERNQERAKEQLSNNFKKNWKDVVEHKPTNKKQRDEAADEFIFNYGLKTRPLEIDDFTPVVSYAQIKEVMSKEEQERFWKWMFGQTTPMYGVYEWDLERWIKGY